MVGTLQFAAIRAFRVRISGQGMMSPPHVASRLGGFLLGYCHGDSPFSGGSAVAATVFLLFSYLEILERAEFKILPFV